MNSFDTLEETGAAIIRRVFGSSELELLRREAARLALHKDQACVRNLFEISECFQKLAHEPKISSQLAPSQIPVRGILFDKTPESNWPVSWHQDLTIAVTAKIDLPDYGPWTVKDGIPHVQPPLAILQKMRTIRIHLDDTHADNGALRVIPGSHRQLNPTSELKHLDSSDQIICECAAGDVLVMSPLVLHASHRAVTPSHRRILHFEYSPEDTLHPELQWHASSRNSPVRQDNTC